MNKKISYSSFKKFLQFYILEHSHQPLNKVSQIITITPTLFFIFYFLFFFSSIHIKLHYTLYLYFNIFYSFFCFTNKKNFTLPDPYPSVPHFPYPILFRLTKPITPSSQHKQKKSRTRTAKPISNFQIKWWSISPFPTKTPPFSLLKHAPFLPKFPCPFTRLYLQWELSFFLLLFSNSLLQIFWLVDFVKLSLVWICNYLPLFCYLTWISEKL